MNNIIQPNKKIFALIGSLTILLLYIYLFFKMIRKANPFSPVRLRKLVRPNLVKPSFLIKHKYKPIYTLRSALEDWKKEDPEVWS